MALRRIRFRNLGDQILGQLSMLVLLAVETTVFDVLGAGSQLLSGKPEAYEHLGRTIIESPERTLGPSLGGRTILH